MLKVNEIENSSQQDLRSIKIYSEKCDILGKLMRIYDSLKEVGVVANSIEKFKL